MMMITMMSFIEEIRETSDDEWRGRYLIDMTKDENDSLVDEMDL